ncbi:MULTISPECIES: TetR/AcrR family transcriptional regulator [Streptomyces]|uniref:TetR/AcrR family transcriptional regulator n=2 Tax=Streptomyces griseoaurantiacus TaxID=68213 RepID=A0ABZ1UUU3_9ACTN|nr:MULTISPECIES: TetR/AcrR family transcriptional regulator [Streptomyces]MBA5223974.1 TetR/AcrR family transcriptional regulator [Streptomyces griseoaurantiacus]MDX3088846.1 TetR/AcrR family transcriptional regulator [Streptomyces sp. ME12-02E]MDX3332195.1 TetR/AcrR family transcriptional regulator [Streptomyces sp. ME02-6978a]MDX3361296.1 TetR/AcrR family transcriptional regulator [Streptomyces sp. ME02-6978.2a]WTI30589.1 TetR/AcrR family transcriptional regulator [Streptomyces jietaisiensis
MTEAARKEPGAGGRPRSEEARAAVLHAVDDLLLEVGYAGVTMKGIAERARVSRQTVYRWWSTKAEVLFEASVNDAAAELAVEPTDDPLADLTAYLEALVRFLAHSPAGAAYRALIGEAQGDPAVAALLATKDVLGDSARAVVRRAVGEGRGKLPLDQATALLIGPTFFWVLSGRDPGRLVARERAEAYLHEVRAGEIMGTA